MQKVTIALAAFLLILGGAALVSAGDRPPAPKSTDWSGLHKLTNQEAQEIRGTGSVLGIQSTAIASALQPRDQSQVQTSYESLPVGFQQCPRDRTQGHWN